MAGFTVRRDQNASLTCTDLLERRQFQGTPRSLGFVKDLYRVDHPELDPVAIEKALAEVEGMCAPALGRIIVGTGMPAPEDVALVLNLAATLALRVPAVRNTFGDFVEEVGTKLTHLTFQHPESYARYLKSREEAGEDVSAAIPFEELKEAWDSGGLKIEANQTFLTLLTFRQMPMIYDLLAARSWSIIRIDQMRIGALLTSDRPLILYNTKPMPPLYGAGFAMPDTEVLFPLDRATALLGRWKSEPEIITSSDAGLLVNRRVIGSAERFLYSPSSWFRYWTDEGIRSSKQLISSHPASRESTGDVV